MHKNIKIDFDDVLIVPATKSNIRSRSEIDYFYDESFSLPIFVSPMDTVISEDNAERFLQNNLRVCMVRGDYKTENNFYSFHSYSLDRFIKIFIDGYMPEIYKTIIDSNRKIYILIDIANGNMQHLIDAISKAKEKYGESIVIMCGNIANPKTFVELSDAGADYVRCGIGGGASCTTSVQTKIGYPMASLISETYQLKKKYNLQAKIVADGGMKSYSDIISALAFGSDYVMVGSLFNKCIESAGDNYFKGFKINKTIASWLFNKGFVIEKKFRGMSTKEVQKKWGKNKLTTSEGVVKRQKVEYTLEGWVENFKDYLKSSMSYCGKKNLEEFIGKVDYVQITNNSFNRFKK